MSGVGGIPALAPLTCPKGSVRQKQEPEPSMAESSDMGSPSSTCIVLPAADPAPPSAAAASAIFGIEVSARATEQASE
eukprot:scaffold152634_cov31-Tisochrysis_lutea.AAC.10